MAVRRLPSRLLLFVSLCLGLFGVGVADRLPYTGSAGAIALAQQLARNVTAGRTLRCACESILADAGVYPGGLPAGTAIAPELLGDGFGYLLPNATSFIPRVLALPKDSSFIKIDRSALGGVNVWALQRVADLGGFQVEFYAVRLPEAMWAKNDKIEMARAMFDLGFDCLFSATLVQPERLPYMQFLLASQTYGFTAVGPGPVVLSEPFFKKLSVWTQPFSWGVWALLFGTLVFAAIFYVVFDGSEVDDWKGENISLLYKLFSAFHYSISGFSGTLYLAPKSWAGMGFSSAYALFLFLMGAAYTANLASFLVKPARPVLVLAGVDDFISNDITACILNKKSHRDWVAQNLPSALKVQVVNGTTATVLAQAIKSGQCEGAITTDVHIRFALGPLDPGCNFADVTPVGSNLNTGFYAIAFSRADGMDAVVQAMSALITFPLQADEYQAQADLIFPHNEQLCAFTVANGAAAQSSSSGGSSSQPTPLSLTNMSGIFLLEALTLVISIGIFVLQNVLERAAKSETLKSIAERVTGKRAAQQEGQDE